MLIGNGRKSEEGCKKWWRRTVKHLISTKIIMQMQTNKKEDFIMLKVIQLFIGQSGEFILNIIQLSGLSWLLSSYLD